MIVAMVIWNNIVASEVDGMGARYFEKNTLIFTDGDIESLLISLDKG